MKYLKYVFLFLSLNVYAQRRAMPITPLILADTLGAKSGDMVVHEDSSKFLLPVWIGGGLVHDVRVYGAKCDGTTNDAAAVQVAIDSANATGGGIVFFRNQLRIHLPYQPQQTALKPMWLLLQERHSALMILLLLSWMIRSQSILMAMIVSTLT